MKKAEEVLSELQSFFVDIHGFKREKVRDRLWLYLDYPDKGLKIVVMTPILEKDGNLELMKGLALEFSVFHKEHKCLEFRDSRIIDKWTNVALKKINTLKELIEGAKECPNCKIFTYPFEDSAPQGKPGSTHFVWYKCEKCNVRLETVWGTGLKTAVARFLKRHFK